MQGHKASLYPFSHTILVSQRLGSLVFFPVGWDMEFLIDLCVDPFWSLLCAMFFLIDLTSEAGLPLVTPLTFVWVLSAVGFCWFLAWMGTAILAGGVAVVLSGEGYVEGVIEV